MSEREYLIGYGEDIHALEEGRPLVLGGIKIPHNKGCIAHSDGDVVLHALSDAILGALNLRDIGYHFKVDDPKWDNASSLLILAEVNKMMKDKGYEINNIDISISAEKPHLNAYIPDMQEAINKVLNCGPEYISIKAMTNEKMDSVGQELAIRVSAIVMLKRV